VAGYWGEFVGVDFAGGGAEWGGLVAVRKSNLQYKKDTKTWSFMENQYDIVETLNQNVGTDYASQNIVSLFGWGTSGKTISNYGSAYQPYATSTTSTAYGPSGNYNLTDAYVNGDWGVNMGTGWRTLTSAEWEYLFNTRSASTVNGTANARYAKAKVNNVYGVILFPDAYTHPSGVTDPVGINATDAAGWNGNTYDAMAWSKMETAGCVFLPAAGFRDEAEVEYAGSDGYYWSSSHRVSDPPFESDTEFAYNMYFGSWSMNPTGYDHRYRGYSVRLVRDAN